MLKLRHNSCISIRRRDLGSFFTVDANGRRLTLGDYIARREKAMDLEERIGPSTARAHEMLTEEPVLSAEDITRIVDQYLASMDDDDVLEIAGQGSYSRAELLQAVHDRTSVGVQVLEMILADHRFVEDQIKRGKYKIKD